MVQQNNISNSDESAQEVSPLVVIVGETASGKSALAMDLAERFDGELVCADSWTVYRGFDIGTAKPTPTDQAKIPHHLLDVADPAEGFSAAVFQRLAKQVIADISARGKLPIMVGGTGLYIDSVLYDYEFLPPGSAELRARLQAMTIEQLLAEIKRDGIDVEGIDTRNKRRLVRLIENHGVRPLRHPMRQNTLVLGTITVRDQFGQRIEHRVDDMLAAGLVQEVAALVQKYTWNVESMRGIGYHEFRHFFAGEQTLAETRQQIIRSTLQLAKKQRTWFKRNSSIQWVSDRSNAVDLLTTFLNKTN